MDKETAFFIANCVAEGVDRYIPAGTIDSALSALHGIAADHAPHLSTTTNGRLSAKCTSSTHAVKPTWPCGAYTAARSALIDFTNNLSRYAAADWEGVGRK